VRDTGTGIRDADKRKLFKLFGFVQSTQDVNTRGIGLGLSISKKIVEKFGGEIGFRSEWGAGSTFGFRVEIAEDLPEQVVKAGLADCSVDTQQILQESDTDRESVEYPVSLLPFNVLAHLTKSQADQMGYLDTIGDIPAPSVCKILIVDDEPFNVDGVSCMLQCFTQRMKHFIFKERVDVACNGIQAVEQVKQTFDAGHRYALILMDCNMP